MQGISGVTAPVRGTWPVLRLGLRLGLRGLVKVLLGADPRPGELPRSWWQRQVAYLVLGGTTLLLSAASLASLAAAPDKLAACPDARVYDMHIVRCPTGASALGMFGGPMNLWALVAVGVVVPLALAIRYPLLGWRMAGLGLVLVPLLDLRWWGGLPWGPAQVVVMLVLLFMAGIRHERTVLGWLFTATLVPWWFWIIWQGQPVITAALGSVAFLALAIAVDRVGSGHRARRDLADQAEQTELERTRRIALEERARIARELHDVVAHHMSLLAIRAESAPHRLGAQLGALPDPVRTEFGLLSGSAREALADMRRLLGVLRSDQPSERAPQPGLRDLPELIDSARHAGMAVELSVPPALDQVPPGAGVCAYRIVQEALSNARRHAPGAPVAVAVDGDADTVTLQVTNGPGVPSAGPPAGPPAVSPAGPRANGHPSGHGLAGMRERAELLGGSLSAGPAADGGFAVCAVLPLGGSTE
jgi:signal transduction histidine kinase